MSDMATAESGERPEPDDVDEDGAQIKSTPVSYQRSATKVYDTLADDVLCGNEREVNDGPTAYREMR